MRTRFWITLWILGILFPMAFLGRLWPAFDRSFEAVFAPTWTHILMHGLLFAGLGFMLASGWKGVSLRSTAVILGIALLLGCLQETIQLLAAGTWPGMAQTGIEAWGAELFDLGIDCLGAAAGLLFAGCLARSTARRAGGRSRSSGPPADPQHKGQHDLI